MSRVADIRDHIIAQVRAIAPTYDGATPHTCIDDGTGEVMSLEDMAAQSAHRVFDLESLGVSEDPMTGVTTIRVRESMQVREVYAGRGERTRRSVAQDTLDIMMRLRNPTNWGAVGIDAIVIRDEDVQTEETDGGLVVSRPLLVLYIEQ